MWLADNLPRKQQKGENPAASAETALIGHPDDARFGVERASVWK
jgi:hypothetical protein